MSVMAASRDAELQCFHGNCLNVFPCTNMRHPSQAPMLKNVLPSSDRSVFSAAVIITEHTVITVEHHCIGFCTNTRSGFCFAAAFTIPTLKTFNIAPFTCCTAEK